MYVWNSLNNITKLNRMRDSTQETRDHINQVRIYLMEAAKELIKRGLVHDKSKLESPEKEALDSCPPIETLEYGTPAYHESCKNIKPALQHHYKLNSHHPQFYSDGINGMNLFDIVEMFFDWKASTERTKDGDIRKSIPINQKRHKINPQLSRIFQNTVDYLWPESKGILDNRAPQQYPTMKETAESINAQTLLRKK